MKASIRKFAVAAFCLLLLPAAGLADGVVTDSCGNQKEVTNLKITIDPCMLAGGGTVSKYDAQARSGPNSFANIESTVRITGVAGQNSELTITIKSRPTWTGQNPVFTTLSLSGSVLVTQPGASVDIRLTGMLGGNPTTGKPLEITQHFADSGEFNVRIFGDQSIADLAVSTLTVTIKGDAFLDLKSVEFLGDRLQPFPEPATLLLLGTGLTGIAMKLRKRRRNDKSAT